MTIFIGGTRVDLVQVAYRLNRAIADEGEREFTFTFEPDESDVALVTALFEKHHRLLLEDIIAEGKQYPLIG